MNVNLHSTERALLRSLIRAEAKRILDDESTLDPRDRQILASIMIDHMPVRPAALPLVALEAKLRHPRNDPLSPYADKSAMLQLIDAEPLGMPLRDGGTCSALALHRAVARRLQSQFPNQTFLAELISGELVTGRLGLSLDTP